MADSIESINKDLNLMDLNSIPAHDSPLHILNALDDFCIQEILRNLDNIEDFLSAAEVCIRFRKNAQSCFPFCYKKICSNGWDGTAPYFIPMKRIGSFLNHFGCFISKINLDFSNELNCIPISDIIPEFFNKSVIKLEASGRYFFEEHDNEPDTIREVGRYVFSFEPSLNKCDMNLKQFTIMIETDFTWLAQKFPNLLYGIFYTFSFQQTNFNDDIFREFLIHNPQLLKISIRHCEYISTKVLKFLADYVPNLVKLTFHPYNSYGQKADIIHLTRMQKLNHLQFDVSEVFVRALVDLLADNNVPISELEIGNSAYDLSKTIPRLKLRRLRFSCVSDTSLIDIVKHTPTLEELTVQFPTSMSFDSIIQILQIGINLKEFSMLIYFLTIDIERYESILAVAKGRTRVQLIICPFRIKVPKHIIDMNREWFNLHSYQTGFIL